MKWFKNVVVRTIFECSFDILCVVIGWQLALLPILPAF